MLNLQTIQHISHNHPLTEVNVAGTYTCDGCKLYGGGKTYRCDECDYDLHVYCATCPPSITNTWHEPGHELILLHSPTHMSEGLCYVCRFYIQGMFYKCKNCSFESHPLCTHGPMHAPYPDATVVEQRSLHDHNGAGQPFFPHQYGQGNPYGYAHMGMHGPYPPQDGGQHQVQNQHNAGSPKADPNACSSTPKKTKKKPGVIRSAAGLTIGLIGQVAIATLTGSFLSE